MTLSEKRTIDIQECVLNFTLLKEDKALVRLDTSTQDEDSFLSSYDLKTGERLLGGFGISSGGLAAVELGQNRHWPLTIGGLTSFGCRYYLLHGSTGRLFSK